MNVPHRDDEPYGREPREPVFNSIPPGVLILAVPIILAQLAAWLVPSIGDWVFEASVLVVAGAGQTAPAQPLGSLFPYVGHILVHFGVFHIVMNLAILFAMGRAVASAFGPGRKGSTGFIILFLLCALAGALAQVLVNGDEPMIMGGASTGVSGLLAAGGWVQGGYRGMLRLAVPWIAVNLLLGLLGMAWPIPVGWAAHIGGTIAGALLYPVMLPLFRDSPLP